MRTLFLLAAIYFFSHSMISGMFPIVVLHDGQDSFSIVMDAFFKDSTLHQAIQKNDAKRVHKIIEKNPESLYAADEKGNTPLHVAADQGSIDIVVMLLEKNAKYNTDEKSSADKNTDPKEKSITWLKKLNEKEQTAAALAMQRAWQTAEKINAEKANKTTYTTTKAYKKEKQNEMNFCLISQNINTAIMKLEQNALIRNIKKSNTTNPDKQTSEEKEGKV